MLKKMFTNQQCCVLLIALTALLVFSHHAAVAQEPCALPQNITYPPSGSLGGTFTQGDGWRNVSCMGSGPSDLCYDDQDYVLRGNRRSGANASFMHGLGWSGHAALEVTITTRPTCLWCWFGNRVMTHGWGTFCLEEGGCFNVPVERYVDPTTYSGLIAQSSQAVSNVSLILGGEQVSLGVRRCHQTHRPDYHHLWGDLYRL